jgi:hypothetical protein
MRGGRREGAGRKPGARNKRTVEVLSAAENVLATIVEPFQGDGVALLQLVYKDPRQPLSIRMSAASLAAKYERPTAVIMKEVPSDVAPEAVDARIRELMKRVLPGPTTIEGTIDEQD